MGELKHIAAAPGGGLMGKTPLTTTDGPCVLYVDVNERDDAPEALKPEFVSLPACAHSAGGMKMIRTLKFGLPSSRPLWFMADCTYAVDKTVESWRPWFVAGAQSRTKMVIILNSFKPATFMGTHEVATRLGFNPPPPGDKPGQFGPIKQMGTLYMFTMNGPRPQDHSHTWTQGWDYFNANGGGAAALPASTLPLATNAGAPTFPAGSSGLYRPPITVPPRVVVADTGVLTMLERRRKAIT